MSETNLSSVDITKTWCDTERILEGLQPAVKTVSQSACVDKPCGSLVLTRLFFRSS